MRLWPNNAGRWTIGIFLAIGVETYVSLAFLFPPDKLIKAVLIAFLIGVTLIATMQRLIRWRPLAIFKTFREIGTAFLIAAIVSYVYENSTRGIAKREEEIAQDQRNVQTLNDVFKVFVGEPVWGAFKELVVGAPFLRKNIQFRLKVLRDFPLKDNTMLSQPQHRAVLLLEYDYDLYPLASNSWDAPLQHALDIDMRDEKLGLPRFESVTIMKSSTWKPQKREYEREELSGLVDETGSIKIPLESALKNTVDLPSPGDKIPLRVLTQRYEIINIPGSYRIVMPVLAAKTDVGSHTIAIAIDELPRNLEVDVNTYYEGLKFHRDNSTPNLWTFDQVMLPGQGFSIIFRNKQPPAEEGKPPDSTGLAKKASN